VKCKALREENANLKLLVSSEGMQELVGIKKERDDLKKENEEMKKFLKDYGLKWVGGQAGNHEGVF